MVEEIRRVAAGARARSLSSKSPARKNLKTDEKDPAMEYAVVKSVAGLMNTEGGTLLVGVADDGSVVGIEEDFPFLGKKNADGWELWLTDLLMTWLGRAAATDVTLRYGGVDGCTVARIAVWPASRPVFLNAKKEKKGVFLVRVNSSIRELAGDDAFTYQ